MMQLSSASRFSQPVSQRVLVERQLVRFGRNNPPPLSNEPIQSAQPSQKNQWALVLGLLSVVSWTLHMLYGQELYRDALAPEAETRMTEQCNLQQMLDNQIFPPTTSSISQCLVRLAEVGIEAGDNPEEMLQKLQQKYGFDRQVLDATNRALTDSASLGSGSWDKRDYVVLFNTWADEVLTRYFSAETVEGIKADQREFLIELQDYHQTSADREALADTLFAYLAVAHLAMPAVAAGVAIAGKSPNQVQQPQN